MFVFDRHVQCVCVCVCVCVLSCISNSIYMYDIVCIND